MSKKQHRTSAGKKRRQNVTGTIMKVPAWVHKAALELLRDPRVLYRVGRKIGELGVVNEAINRLILYLAAIALVSVIVKGPSASGKSELVKTSISLLPPERVI